MFWFESPKANIKAAIKELVRTLATFLTFTASKGIHISRRDIVFAVRSLICEGNPSETSEIYV